jgi:3-hydroxyacyl-[acyl-carrier-protein] dehydratase
MLNKVFLDQEGIKKLIPHRDEFLLIDSVLDFNKDEESITCSRAIKKNDWFFKGHFPDHPIMPGVLIIEALAQSAAVYAMLNMPEDQHNKPVFFVSIENARFKAPVYPESDLILCAKCIKKSRMLWKFHCVAKLQEKICTEATIMATISV